MHSYPHFEVVAMYYFLPRVENMTLAAYGHQG